MLFETLLMLLDPVIIFSIFAGVSAGLFVGAMPGLTATMALAVLLPFTFTLPPLHGLVEHERMNILAALGSFRERALIEKAQQYILDKVPARNKFVPITYMAANPYAIPYMWEWYGSHLEELEKFHPMHYERVIAAVVPLCGLGYEEEIRTFFQDYMSKKEGSKDVIRLSLERLEINSKMRNL